jgi:thiol-disulfide isomerase/thioredoxin
MKEYMTVIKSIEQFEEATKQTSIFVFSGNWCPDCMFLETFMQSLVEENNQWTFYYISRDDEATLPLFMDLNVFGIPSFVAFKNGEEVGRFVSKNRKSKPEIQAFIDGVN